MQAGQAGIKNQLPEHLFPLVADQWAIWRWVVVRSAGFPVGMVSQLTNYECASAADQMLAAERELGTANKQALRKVCQALDQTEKHSTVASSTRDELVRAVG